MNANGVDEGGVVCTRRSPSRVWTRCSTALVRCALATLLLVPAEAVPAGEAGWRHHMAAGGRAEVMGEVRDATRAYRAAVAEAEGGDWPQARDHLCDALVALGSAYVSRHRFAAAVDVLRGAVDGAAAPCEKGSARLADALDALGFASIHVGAPDRARRLLEKAMTIRVVELGYDHPAVVSSLLHLGASNLALGRHLQADLYFRQALRAGERAAASSHSFEPIHLATVSLTNVALLDASRGALAAAESTLLEVLRMQRSWLVEGHPEIARTLAALATVRAGQGRRDRAVADLENALAIYEERLGAAAVPVARVRARLAAMRDEGGSADSREAAVVDGLAMASAGRSGTGTWPWDPALTCLVGFDQAPQALPGFCGRITVGAPEIEMGLR